MHSLLSALFLAGSALALPAASTPTQHSYPPPPPPPPPAGCNAKSTHIKDWTVENFDFHASYTFSTPAHQIADGFVNFTLSNPAVDYKATCSASSSQLQDFFYGTVIYKCDVPVKSDEATFTFSRPDNNLRINQTWNCADAGSRFTAQGGVKLDLDCKDETWKNPDWKIGQIYSSRTVTCNKVTVPAPIESISGVL